MKNAVVLYLIFLVGINSVVAQIPTNGLIGKYSFNGNAKNELGEYANGIVVGATLTSDRCGLLSNAYHFTSNHDHIAIRILGDWWSINELSISLWAKADYLTSNCMVMLYPDNWNDRCVICAQYINNPSMMIWDIGDCSYNGRSVVTGIAISNAWHHYVFISSKSKNIKAIYLDSICMSLQSYMGSLINFNRDLYIGAGFDWSGSGIGFKGSIDDLRIYNRALEVPEVRSLFHENPCFNENSKWESSTNQEVNFFPVPAYEKINITGFDNGIIEIFSIQGQLLQTRQLTDKQTIIDISMLKNGIYIIKISTKNGVWTKQILVNQIRK